MNKLSLNHKLLDTSSNLNRIVNFYIRGSSNFDYFVMESSELLESIDDSEILPKHKLILEGAKKTIDSMKNNANIELNLIDDILTYSIRLSNIAPIYKING